jgi:hypothetical protein
MIVFYVNHSLIFHAERIRIIIFLSAAFVVGGGRHAEVEAGAFD